MRISDRVGTMKYAIRDVQKIANDLQKQGKEIMYFNIGDPNKFDFNVPEAMQDALRHHTNKGFYSQSEGDLYVRQKIADYEDSKYRNGVSSNDVIFTDGVSEGILFVFLSFLNPGDKILVPAPTYPAYQSAGTVTQAELTVYKCIEEEGWIPDVEDIRSKIDSKTKILVLINPNNPTGSVYHEQRLRKIRDLAGEHDLVIISDEIYDRMILDQETSYKSFSQITKDVPAIIFNGFSKNYLAPGFRAGYMYTLDLENKISEPYEGVKKLCRMRLSPSTPISYAAVDTLSMNPPHLPNLIGKLKSRRNYVTKRFQDMDNISTTKPQAAFYIFPKIEMINLNFSNDFELVMGLLKEEGVLFVHGSGFGVPDHFRMVFLSPENILEEGLNRFERFLERHSS